MRESSPPLTAVSVRLRSGDQADSKRLRGAARPPQTPAVPQDEGSGWRAFVPSRDTPVMPTSTRGMPGLRAIRHRYHSPRQAPPRAAPEKAGVPRRSPMPSAEGRRTRVAAVTNLWLRYTTRSASHTTHREFSWALTSDSIGCDRWGLPVAFPDTLAPVAAGD